MAAGDLAVLATIEAIAPETYAVVSVLALFFICAHAEVQGERRGTALALAYVAVLASVAAIAGAPGSARSLVATELLFAIAAVGAALLVGRMRSAESAARLRARRLTRRVIEAEREVRRRLAESIHDGPIQELSGLSMVLHAARQAAADGDTDRAQALIGEASALTDHNVQVLRDDIVDLGPYAFEERSFQAAVESCIVTWQRRYGVEVLLTIEELDLAPELAGDLFRITQEAVTNAGRHASAEQVAVSLRGVNGGVELRVTDDGKGFEGVDPLGPVEPGHIGLASIRERAELLEGELDIETSEKGTRVLVQAPLPQPED
jgi:two-component system NarL family sensor kinase